MATDQSEPRVGVILKVAVISIGTLVAVRAALTAYFDQIAQAEEHRKYGEQAPEALTNLRSDERARLTSGPMPIDRAMQLLTTRGRKEASPDIMPSASKDMAPLQGWSKMPADVPAEMIAVPSMQSAGVPSVSDAGAAVATAEGGAANATKPDRTRPDAGPSSSKPPPKNP
ncbi:MAG: hypothetical protein M3O46_21250 [Myxococcota bacterium]|nr:hypothetical protein [Myxococcota bacterium]